MRQESGAWSPGSVLAFGLMAVLGLLVVENLGAGRLNELLLHLPGVDKVLHAGQGLVVFVLLYWLLGLTRVSASTVLILAAAGALGAAVLDEIQQQWRGDRHVELADIGAGLSGIVIGAAFLKRTIWPRLAILAALAGLALACGLTYESYRQTKDYNRGLLADRAGRTGEAREHYLRAVAAGVDNPEAYNAAAWAIVQSGGGDLEQAVALAERSLAMRPDNADTLDTYGWALYRAGRAADAVAPLEQAFAAKPDIYCIHYHLGMVYLDLGRREAGVRHLRRQVEEMPGTLEARLSTEVLNRLDRSARGNR